MSNVTKFTPEAFQKIADMIREGASSFEIAEQVGTTEQSLRTMCSRVGISLRRQVVLPGDVAIIRVKFKLDYDALHCFTKYADDTGRTFSQLVGDLLAVIAKDNMIKAVLDEGGEKT